MKTRRSNIIALVLAILVILAAGYSAAFGIGDFEGCFDKGAVTLGLDIAGGTSIMYSPAGDYEPTEDEAKLMKEMIAETIMEEHGKTPEEFVCELEDFDYSVMCQ